MEKQQQSPLTFEAVWAMFQETDKRFQETDKRFQETDKRFQETDKRYQENLKQLKEIGKRFRKTEQLMNENAIKAEERSKILDARLDRLGKYVGGIANSNGDMAEDFFYNTLRRDKTFLNEKFDSIRKNLTYRGLNNEYEVEPDAEYDILLFNGTSAALIEVKYNAKQNNIDIKKLLRRAEIFKIQFPEYKNHKLYLAVAAMSFKGWIVKKLHRAGIATIRQVGRKMVVYDKEVKAF